MHINELKSGLLKKRFGCTKCRFRYHNKNKSGGNFAIELHTMNGKSYDLHGYYDFCGTITSLDFGPFFQVGHEIPHENLGETLEYITNILNIQRGELALKKQKE